MQRLPFYADPIEHTNRYIHHNRMLEGPATADIGEVLRTRHIARPARPSPAPLAQAFRRNSASATAIFAVLLPNR